MLKNILSYKQNSIFTGKEIKDWILYNLKNKTSKSKIAKRMMKFLNIKDNVLYTINLNYIGTGCGQIIYKPIILKTK